jgi:ribulose-5-phosphate 4-epimerase/fuculose-1-phosphate aldolase
MRGEKGIDCYTALTYPADTMTEANGMTREQKIQNAADDCRDNAVATVVERHGRATVEAWNFNTYENAMATEKLAQAAYFADQYGVTTDEVLRALYLRD